MANNDSKQRDAVVIERTMDAPPKLVWQMWTDPDHLASWYGPDGSTIPTASLDVRVGGSRRVCMEVSTPDGPQRMWFGGEHLEVIEARRLVYTEFMADETGSMLPASESPQPGDVPQTTEVTVELEAIGAGTRMVLTHAGIPADSPGAAGWKMAFEKLDARLQEHAGRRE